MLGYSSQEGIFFPLSIEFSYIQANILASICFRQAHVVPMSMGTMQKHLQRDFSVGRQDFFLSHFIIGSYIDLG